ncbi:carboxylesterase family protein [Streptomyces sp. NPDC088190]|uniref:carboxylesterase family protein n=1 Tax=unclassified Streptomyces TaxID=2593676 RepID=UPI002E7685AD|nr:carboxylesterase family protein [Streptomyces sp. JV190]MEE1840432.1 carboxylesterase family protein [Streptomyces sp. JV190]
MTGPAVVRSGPVRYAVAERFARPRPVRDGDRPPTGEICPQLPSRLDAVMGPPLDRHPQGEDCLNLTVTTPARDGAARPVMVWFHGGGFSSGAGLMDWYDGGALATEGDVVVVAVNYRVGALGYLCLDGVSEGNLGLYDQLEALRWVRRHIAAYGGDPADVTVFGQSAGALSIRLLMELPEARGLFRRAILQSAPLPIATRSRADAEVLGRIFGERLAVHAPGADPRTAGQAAVLAAQRDTGLAHRERSGSTLEPPFGPVGTAVATPGPQVRGLDIMYGWNADDMTAFPGEKSANGDPAEPTRRMYTEPLTALGQQLVRAGARVHAYRLDWRPAGSAYGATHCVELPLLLGSRAAWRDSPMLGDTTWEEVDELGRAVRATWIAFVRTGRPGAVAPPLTCREILPPRP